ncbi:transposase [Azomonas macrocytogenes]|uniref:transposase n=1 Tax=Azomonas macrocytogenes TaxID=69962 RepID=UPI003B83932B
MGEALCDTHLYREFAQLAIDDRSPDAVTILRFRHLLKRHDLATEPLATVNKELQRLATGIQG